MALRAFKAELTEKIDNESIEFNNTTIIDFLDEYIEAEDEKYRKNKQNKALTFGKWKGFTIKELSVSEKGKSYLEWLLAQAWCDEEKFGFIHEECKALNIKKKITKRAVLN
jgi:hypothetical protein